MTRPVLGLVACAAGGIEDIRVELIAPLQADGWDVAVTLTPTATTWLQASGELGRIEAVTGFRVRADPRLPTEASPHPPVDCYAVIPATANTVAKLALGIADNQALTTVCEAIGNRNPSVVIFPRINAAHAAQPAWSDHLDALRRCGVRLVYGEDVWPLHAPRAAPSRRLPWSALRAVIAEAGHSARGGGN